MLFWKHGASHFNNRILVKTWIKKDVDAVHSNFYHMYQNITLFEMSGLFQYYSFCVFQDPHSLQRLLICPAEPAVPPAVPPQCTETLAAT